MNRKMSNVVAQKCINTNAALCLNNGHQPIKPLIDCSSLSAGLCKYILLNLELMARKMNNFVGQY